MIIITYREKVMLDKEVSSLYDPITKGNGVAFVVSQKYSEIFLLAFFPAFKKTVTAYSMTTNDPIPLAVWTPEMQKAAETAKSEAKGTWKLFMFWYVFLILIGGAFIYTRLQMRSKNNDAKQQSEYFANPQVGDIIYANTFKNGGNGDVVVSPFKIVAERGDTLFVLYSEEEKLSGTNFLDPSKAVGSFDISENKFNKDTLVFQKSSYKSRHLTPFSKNKADIEISSSDTKADLIEIIYIQR